MAQEIFKRYEKKYRLTQQQYQLLQHRLRSHMTADQYGQHRICNIYYDTPDYELIRTSLEKPDYKEKVRLRSYGAAGDEDTVYLELKKKFDGIVYKRRAAMALREAEAYVNRGVRPTRDGQILKELDYAFHRYELKPAVYLAYDRTAYDSPENPELRITFDTGITGRSCELDLRQESWGYEILPGNEVLMEIKIPGAVPVWLGRLLSDLEIFPCSFSKYGTYYQNCILKKLTEGGRACA